MEWELNGNNFPVHGKFVLTHSIHVFPIPVTLYSHVYMTLLIRIQIRNPYCMLDKAPD